MAADITKAKSDQPIKNGAITTSTTFTGQSSELDSYMITGPTDINSIASKYDDKFDDLDYYFSNTIETYMLGNLQTMNSLP